MPNIKPPSTLATAGKALWRSITSKYDLRPDELAILENACVTSDMVAALTAVWMEDGAPSISKGSMGQEVIHPLIGEIRAQRAYRDAALARLKLPEDPAGEKPAESASDKARRAAVARWERGAS